MDKIQAGKAAQDFLETWNSQDIETVVACYSADVSFVDPNTRGILHGADAMRRYLAKLFAAWNMHWTVREAHPLKDQEGYVLLWRASLARTGSDRAMEIDGMDLVIIENNLIKRNEVYFDKSVLTALFEKD